MKNEAIYTHETGLKFDTARLMDSSEKDSYDISVVILWLPNCATTPMKIIDWYCGEPSTATTKEYADRWCNEMSAQELEILLELQDMQ